MLGGESNTDEAWVFLINRTRYKSKFEACLYIVMAEGICVLGAMLLYPAISFSNSNKIRSSMMWRFSVFSFSPERARSFINSTALGKNIIHKERYTHHYK